MNTWSIPVFSAIRNFILSRMERTSPSKNTRSHLEQYSRVSAGPSFFGAYSTVWNTSWKSFSSGCQRNGLCARISTHCTPQIHVVNQATRYNAGVADGVAVGALGVWVGGSGHSPLHSPLFSSTARRCASINRA